MTAPHPDRLFPAEPHSRNVAREIYETVRDLPIVAESDRAAESFIDDEAACAAYETANLARLNLRQSPLDDLSGYERLRAGSWPGRIAPLYCADDVIDPEIPGFVDRLDRFGQMADRDAYTWKGYLEAHGIRREIFKLYGCRATAHRHPSARAESLDAGEKTSLFRKVCIGKANAAEAELFRAVMLVEMARLSEEDGLSLHVHAGQGHMASIVSPAGRRAEIVLPVDYIRAARPLLDAFGDNTSFRIAFFSRSVAAIENEIMPLAEAFPAVEAGLSGGCHNPPSRLRAFREAVLASDDPAISAPLQGFAHELPTLADQHDTARRVDCAVLAEQVAIHQLQLDEATGIARRWAIGG
ncbi:MAG: glucuronate isomerase [Beijerinckiaceae bacterium]|nr:glucuronate isomerase [Beijerinckiaceae bacterium]